MDGKVGYSFAQMMEHYNILLKVREDIVWTLSLHIDRSGSELNRLLSDLKVISDKINDFERKVVWTEQIK